MSGWTPVMAPGTRRWFATVAARVLHGPGIRAAVRRLDAAIEAHRDGQGQVAFPYVRRRRTRTFQILIYHRINDERDPFFPGTPTSVFARQMEYLASTFTVWPLETLVEGMRTGDLPERGIAITFDDGYRDNFVNAFPVLLRLRLPATVFLATGAVDSGRPLWHDRVFALFRETRADRLDAFNAVGRELQWSTVEERVAVQERVLGFLRSLGEAERDMWIDRLAEPLGVTSAPRRARLMLDWGEVRRMHGAGVSFGAHTVTHPILTRLPAERVREEVGQSKKRIEDELGIPVRSFAYPNGGRHDFNDSTKSVLREVGYVCAVTSLPGTNTSGRDAFELRRGTPWDEDALAFGARLSYFRFSG